MRRTVSVLDRADVVYTMNAEGRIVGWIVLEDGTLRQLGPSEVIGTMDGPKARAAIAQVYENQR